MKSRSQSLYRKSLSAMLAAIEIYNKPDFFYREEVFSILAVNAWELLLKARILQLNGGKVNEIVEFEKRHKLDGSLAKKKFKKKNRSGNDVSIGLFKSFDVLANQYEDVINPIVRTNLELLTEIRDNSVHFFNKDIDLCKRILEIGTASLRNYVAVSKKWFDVDLGNYNFFIMPMAFFRDFYTSEAVPPNGEERRLIEFLKTRQRNESSDMDSEYSVTLEIGIQLKKKSDELMTQVIITNDPTAAPVIIVEEDVLKKYPWEYKDLCRYLKNRYCDFLQNQKFHDIKKTMEGNSAFCLIRRLDPSKQNGGTKKFYNSNIVKEFDKHYTVKS